MADGAGCEVEGNDHPRARSLPPVLLAVGLIAGSVLAAACLPKLLATTGAGPRASSATAGARGEGSAGSGSAPPACTVLTAVPASVPAPGPVDRATPDTVLAGRAAAVLGRDLAGWLASVNGVAARARARQSCEFERIIALPVVRWGYRVIILRPSQAPTGLPGGTGTYAATVELSYRLAGDTRDVVRTRAVTFRRRTAGWWLESDEPATDADRDLWDVGPLTVARGSRAVAVSLAGAPSSAGGLARRVNAAAQAVDAAWAVSWPRPVVTVLPADLDGMAAVLGRRDARGLDRLAAVTSGRLDRGHGGPEAVAGAADRVVLNPVVWARLTDAGRRVVLVHELAHVATRATTPATPPTWLDEGFATYVGYRGSGLTDAEIAADALSAVRAGRLPAALPGADAFNPADGDPDPAYAQAWVACDLVVRRVGISGLVAVYRSAASGGGGEVRADAALLRVLGENTDSFIVQWQQRLQELARAGG